MIKKIKKSKFHKKKHVIQNTKYNQLMGKGYKKSTTNMEEFLISKGQTARIFRFS